MIEFMNPKVLWLLALLPIPGVLSSRPGISAALLFPSTRVAENVSRRTKSKAGKWMPDLMTALRMIAAGLLITGLAGPRLVNTETEAKASGIDILLAIDVSGSMEAMDFKINGKETNRMDIVKNVVSKFINERPDDRIGLVAFAGRPYMVSPLTLDHDWLVRRLESIRTGTIEDGTAIGSALASAVNQLRSTDAASKTAILLTDGVNNAGRISPVMAAEAAEALGVKIYTIGAGSHGTAPVPVTDRYGNKRMAMAKVEIDEDTLTQVSEMTGGRYYRAADTGSLEKIYNEINKLEKTTRTVKQYRQYRELFPWAVAAGALTLFIQIFLGQTRFRRLP